MKKLIWVIFAIVLVGCTTTSTPIKTNSKVEINEKDSLFVKILKEEEAKAKAFSTYLFSTTVDKRKQLSKMYNDTTVDAYNIRMMAYATDQYIGDYRIISYKGEVVDSFEVVRYKDKMIANIDTLQLPVFIHSGLSFQIGTTYYTAIQLDTTSQIYVTIGHLIRKK